MSTLGRKGNVSESEIVWYARYAFFGGLRWILSIFTARKRIGHSNGSARETEEPHGMNHHGSSRGYRQRSDLAGRTAGFGPAGRFVVPTARNPQEAVTDSAANGSIPTGARTGGFWEILTPRERQIATEVESGATDREIARLLQISPRTVHKHLEQIYRKLGLTNRGGLIVLMYQRRGEQTATGEQTARTTENHS